MKVVFYENAKSPICDFIAAMERRDRTDVLGRLKNIESLGFCAPRVKFRHIRGRLWEIKIETFNVGYRFFYVCVRDLIVILHAYKKKSQKIPNKEITIANRRLSEVLKNETNYIR